MVSEQSGSKSNCKFMTEISLHMAHEKVPSIKDLLTAIRENWNHFDMCIALN